MTPAKGPGLRLQIVLSLAGVLLLSYVPLFFAIAGVTSATLLASRERAAHSIGRAVASHVAHATEAGQLADLDAVLTADVGSGGARAIAVFDLDGHRIVEAGELAELARLEAPPRPYRESARPAHGARGRALDVVLPAKAAAVVVRVATDEESVNAAPLVKVVALYMLVFAIALLAFAYFVLTRVLVRPIEELSAAAERVARGARVLDVPRRGAREVIELGRAVDAMASKLLDDEQALRAKVEELTRMTTTLTEARAQLARSEQLASVGRLSAGLAHEIGNPLTAVLAMLDLVADPELPVEERQDFIARMKRETERIHGILRDLLDFARPEANAATSERGASARLEEVLSDLEALALPQRPFREVALIIRVEEGTPRVGMSASRLLQVLLNLVLNAADAVASAEAPREIRVLARRSGAGVEVRVEDTGPGVPAALAARVFEPFVTTKDVGQGTGLGLAVCRGLVESAGGAITLDPTYEGGARFVVTLPAASE